MELEEFDKVYARFTGQLSRDYVLFRRAWLVTALAVIALCIVTLAGTMGLTYYKVATLSSEKIVTEINRHQVMKQLEQRIADADLLIERLRTAAGDADKVQEALADAASINHRFAVAFINDSHLANTLLPESGKSPREWAGFVKTLADKYLTKDPSVLDVLRREASGQ